MKEQIDTFWRQIKAEAEDIANADPLLTSYFHNHIIIQQGFEYALAHLIAEKLHSDVVSELMLRELFTDSLLNNQEVSLAAQADLQAYFDRDPACSNHCQPFLFFKGFHATQAYRLSHILWSSNRRYLARYLHSRSSLRFQVDIHPAARVGHGLMLDHATGIVVGETAVIGNNVSMLHGVTLGGTGSDPVKRHPEIGDGVMISCGAKLIGPIQVGNSVKVGGGSLVLESVPESVTVVGVPAKIVGKPSEDCPAFSMNQSISD